MPTAALRICTYPGCINLVRSGRCDAHPQKPARQYPRDPVIQKLYNSKRWKVIRKAQLEAEPFCRSHARRGQLVIATDVDHVNPHNGDVVKFFAGPFQSLCHSCHATKTDSERTAQTQGA